MKEVGCKEEKKSSEEEDQAGERSMHCPGMIELARGSC